MSADRWTYDENVGRYRDTSTGRFISQSQMLGLRDTFVAERKAMSGSIVDAAFADVPRGIPPSVMTRQQREAYERAFTAIFGADGSGGTARDAWAQTIQAEFLLGRGGINAMSPDDFDYLSALIVEYDGFWAAFVEEIAAGLDGGDGLSVNQIRARVGMYVEAGTRAYEEARARAYSVDLPAYPGDGRTVCLSNCRCTWVISRRADGFHCTWTLGGNESCHDCVDNAARWSPLIIPYEEESDG